MDKNDITRIVRNAKIPKYTENDIPSLDDQIKFMDTQIAEVEKVAFRFVSEIEVNKYYLENSDPQVQQVGEQELKKAAAQLKSYLITLKGMKRFRVSLEEQKQNGQVEQTTTSIESESSNS